ncbi:MAG TPA: acyl carrier protein [Oscillatoriaceae cyanobacterium]
MSVLQKVTEVVAEVLEVDAATLDPDANLIKDLNMDSVLAIDIATLLEKHYHVQVPDERMEELTSVRAIAHLVEGLLAAGRA